MSQTASLEQIKPPGLPEDKVLWGGEGKEDSQG
jgi:hypothetical protein